ncbi:hypothetical protein PCANC_17160 [Puccinia coronata f. sp. avenae]|uniref:Uncharacterized protein n=1 Tax=Puccinia coronata f. sp. avenae TaxID=200324 RepID=A0A2N5UIX4_9BASI|nr:hypothetical protein PCANC_17160 [Puccinia coronata f. sp. avenae]
MEVGLSPSTPDILMSDDQAESDWTKLSIPNMRSRSTTSRTNAPGSSQTQTTTTTGHHHHQQTTHSSSSRSTMKASGADSITTQLLPPEQSYQYVEESDSSTNFDPQAWKRGDKGVGRGKTKANEEEVVRKRSTEHNQNTSNNRPYSSSSFFFEAAFISPQATSTAISPDQSAQRRRPISSSRKASTPIRSTFSTTRVDEHHHTHTRPSSDLGPPSTLSAGRGMRSSPPTWRAYTGRDGSASSSVARTADQKQEFLQAISNLQAMAKMGKFEWLSASSENEADDPDADEPRPGHADLPTSTFNSAIGEDDHHHDDDPLLLKATPQPHPHNPDSYPSFFARLWSYIGGAVSLKTWQFIGLGGIIFGFGICAGSFIGKNLSSKNVRMPRLFSLA